MNLQPLKHDMCRLNGSEKHEPLNLSRTGWRTHQLQYEIATLRVDSGKGLSSVMTLTHWLLALGFIAKRRHDTALYPHYWHNHGSREWLRSLATVTTISPRKGSGRHDLSIQFLPHSSGPVLWYIIRGCQETLCIVKDCYFSRMWQLGNSENNIRFWVLSAFVQLSNISYFLIDVYWCTFGLIVNILADCFF